MNFVDAALKELVLCVYTASIRSRTSEKIFFFDSTENVLDYAATLQNPKSLPVALLPVSDRSRCLLGFKEQRKGISETTKLLKG